MLRGFSPYVEGLLAPQTPSPGLLAPDLGREQVPCTLLLKIMQLSDFY